MSNPGHRMTRDVTEDATGASRTDVLAEPDVFAVNPAVGGTDELRTGSALLMVKRGPNAGARFWLNQDVTTAGRHPNSDIFLDDVTASRRHAEFRGHGSEFHVIDTDSLDGTFVNGTPVHSAVLAPGDQIHIGKFCLVFLDQPPTD